MAQNPCLRKSLEFPRTVWDLWNLGGYPGFRKFWSSNLDLELVLAQDIKGVRGVSDVVSQLFKHLPKQHQQSSQSNLRLSSTRNLDWSGSEQTEILAEGYFVDQSLDIGHSWPRLWNRSNLNRCQNSVHGGRKGRGAEDRGLGEREHTSILQLETLQHWTSFIAMGFLCMIAWGSLFSFGLAWKVIRLVTTI